jgi:integrase
MTQSTSTELVVLPAGASVPARVSAPLSEELRASIRENQGNASAANTNRAYLSDWAAFERWCDENDQVALPASDETVAAYLTDRAAVVDPVTGEYTYAPSTISRWLTSINVRHHADDLPQPGSFGKVKSTLAGIRRGHVRPTRRMAPLLLEDLKKVLMGIDTQSYPDGIIGHRDAALLVMGFAGAFRRSELSSRRIGDVTVHAEDGLHVRLITSKTDQEGRGSVKGLPFGANPLTCPPCAFLRWIRVLEAAPGPRAALMRLLRESNTDVHICQMPTLELERLDPKAALFRPIRRGGHIGSTMISGDVVNSVIKRRLTAVGMNAKRFGGHSLRAGFVTQALRSGATPQEVMRQTDHRNVSTVETYRREHDPLRQNAVTRLGL